MTENNLAWHFVGPTLRDGRPIPPDGETLRHDGPLKLCASGFHCSHRIRDALSYALGDTICRVRYGGPFIEARDMLVATERTILWRIDGASVLREFARRQALSVVHLWDAPEVVRRYLETGDEALRGDAWSAALVAHVAHDAARAAAVWAATQSAARLAAHNAIEEAAWAATQGAALAAARDAANDMLTEMVMAAHAKEAA